MLDLARGYFRRTVFRTYRFLKHPRKLRRSRFMRWFARHFLDKHVWRPTQHTLAGGMAVGLFVMMQLIPGQMPLAILLAAALRVNIPIAVIACWISNPATFVPIGWFEKEVGDWVLSFFGDPFGHFIDSIVEESGAKGLRFARSMYLGGVISGALLAPVGYLVTWAGWGWFGKWVTKRHRKQHPDTTATAQKGDPAS